MAGLSADYVYDTDLTDSDQDIDALMSGKYWAITTVTYSFPDAASDYGYGPEKLDHFAQLTTLGQAAMRVAIGDVAGFTMLAFNELGDDPGENDADAVIRISQSDDPATAFAYFPSETERGGDIWVRNTPPAWDSHGFDTPVMGRWGYFTLYHEFGHALGLKHGHDTSGPGAMTAAHDGMEFSVMTYRSHPGGGTGGYTNEPYGYAQSFMMYDIAALQRLYGADFTHESGNTVYTFSKTTGEMFINGVGQGTPGANRIFRTIWDGDGQDTFKLDNYNSDLDIDLRPGKWSDFSAGSNFQNAKLDTGVFARGHVFNALLYHGDKRSLIEDVIAGSGNDRINGNGAANHVRGKDGDDVIHGRGHADVIKGGGGNDFLYAENGKDTIIDGSGKDSIRGGGKADLFIFVRDDTRDVISDWEPGEIMDISAWGLSGMSDLKVFEQPNGNIAINELGGSESIYLKNYMVGGSPAFSAADIDASVFLF